MNCLKCNTEFIPKVANQKYCCHKCGKSVWDKNYKNTHKENIDKYRLKIRPKLLKYNKQWRLNNISHVRIYENEHKKERKLKDPIFKITCSLRSKLWKLSKGIKKSINSKDILTCSYNEFKNHLESKKQEIVNLDINTLTPVEALMKLCSAVYQLL
jgi:hypothetical protein